MIHPCRKLDLLLVGGERLKRADMRIASICIHPEGDAIKVERKIDSVVGGYSCSYSTYGEDNARAATTVVFKANSSYSADANFLSQLVRRAIEAGISACGLHPHGSEVACGGRTFVRRTFYT